jgi:hypothetical protein
LILTKNLNAVRGLNSSIIIQSYVRTDSLDSSYKIQQKKMKSHQFHRFFAFAGLLLGRGT